MSKLYDIFLRSKGLTTDTRKIQKDCIFLALKGENFDGNEFAVKALHLGAICSVVEASSPIGQCVLRAQELEIQSSEDLSVSGDFDSEDSDNLLDGFSLDRFFVVEDSLKALQDLSREHRSRFNIPIIGLTGTNGKTTTKELLAAVLSTRYNVLATAGNLNNHIGVPLTLLGLTSEHEVAVIEMGASSPGEIKTLCNIALPTYGLITNVGKAHLQGFGSFDGVKKAKGELYDYLQRTFDVCFVNVDNPELVEMATCRPDLRRVSYGWKYWGAEIMPLNAAEPFIRLSMPVSEGIFSSAAVVKTNLVGVYNADNVAAAIAVGRYFKLTQEEICVGLAGYVPKNNRSQLEDTGRNKVLIDAYNANPSSMKAALENFNAMDFEEKVLILGDMRELGEDSYAEHEKILIALGQSDFSAAYLVGPEFGALAARNSDSRIRFFENVDELKQFFTAHALSKSVVLLKGSNGIHLPELMEVL